MAEKRFTGFAEMASSFKNEEKEARERRFETFLAGRLAEVPAGNYESALPGIASLTLSHPLPEHAAKVLNATLFYPQTNGREGHVTVTVNDRRILGGDRLPRELAGLGQDAILDEILRVAEAIDPRFWCPTGLAIVPDADPRETENLVDRRMPGADDDEPERRDVPTGRLEFIRRQPGIAFGFFNEREGFHGYRVSVFPTFLVLECEEKGHAAFVVDTPTLERLAPPERERIAEWFTMEQAARNAIADTVWGPVAAEARTRRELVTKLGAERITHQGAEETWQGKLTEAIARRLPNAETQ